MLTFEPDHYRQAVDAGVTILVRAWDENKTQKKAQAEILALSGSIRVDIAPE